MKRKIWVVLEDTGVSAVVAAEALRKAAGDQGKEIAVEIRGANGAREAFTGTPGVEDALLLVGQAQAGVPFAGLPSHEAPLDRVLSNAAAVLEDVFRASGPGRPGAVPAPAPSAPAAGEGKHIVAVTACPTGIAHTFMAAEGLRKAAEALGYGMRVETQGSVGAGTPLTPEEIAAADLVMIAADREVDRARFAGKRVFASGTKPAITAGQELIKKAFAEAVVQGRPESAEKTPDAGEKKAGPYKHLMTGVSFMLPFVVAGGLLIALSFALGGIYAGSEEGSLAWVLSMIGGKGGFALMVPVLAGYIAYSVADRPGIAPGMIGGMICNIMGTGFLGGIAAGFLAGYGVSFLSRAIRLPRNLAGLMPVLILPLLGTLLTGLVMYYILGKPMAAINAGLTNWLNGLQGTGSLVLGLVIGGMMALDMGGPVNKAAYASSVALLGNEIYLPMAAAMGAGMVPPLAAALSTRLFKNRYSEEEREAGGAAFVLGLSFVSEGAIPFAARDPFRVIPAFVIGAAVTGALSMAFQCGLRAPHGGVFVLFIPDAVIHLGPYIGAIVAGTVISAVIMGFLKKPLKG